MTLLDAKDIKDLVEDKWELSNPSPLESLIEHITNGDFEDSTNGWTVTGSGSSVSTTYAHSPTHSIKQTGFPTVGILTQVLGTPALVSNITVFGFWMKQADGGVYNYARVKITYTDDVVQTLTDKTGGADFSYVDLLSSLSIGKTVKSISIELHIGNMTDVYIDDVTLVTSTASNMLLQLDEYNPLHPDYQIVFINRPERTVFISPNVIKHEQDINVEIHVKLVRYEPTNVDEKRTIFKAMKGELSRIFNTFRFDNVGSTINVSAWADAKLPHGFGVDAEPLEFTTRLTMQIFYYESTDGTLTGVRVSRVEILGSDLLGLIDASWIDTSPWVHLQVPKGPLLEQHLLGPHIDGEISTHDYASLYELLYQTPIVEGSIKYPVLINQTKLKFSSSANPSDPQFIIELVDDEGTTYTYNFFDVRIKQVELVKTNTTGQNEAVWRITWMADFVYYVHHQLRR